MSAQPQCLMTAEEFAALPRDGWRYELIRPVLPGLSVAVADLFG